MQDDKNLFLKHIGQTSPFPALLEVENAEGSYITDKQGKKYLDFISGISVSNLGHNNPAIIRSIKEQTDRYLHVMVYGEYVESPQVKFAKLLTDNLHASLNAVYMVNSGSEAVETAMKLAKRVTGRNKILHFRDSYHGSTQGALSMAGTEKMKNAFRPLLPGIETLKFNNTDELDQINNDTAAVFIEPVQGEGGVRHASADFLKALKERCQYTGALLIFDEIQTGFGRTGKLFAHFHYDIIPDILLTGKAMGGGLPLGGVIASRDLLNAFTHNPILGHITTFGGHPLSCAAAYASLSTILEMNLDERASEVENLIRSELQHPEIEALRGSGWFWAVSVGDADRVLKVCNECRKNGLIADWFLFCPEALRLAPPLTISNDEIKEACRILTNALNTIKSGE